jgi:ATP adenylyltransferase
MNSEHLHAYWRMEYIEAPRPKGSESRNPFRDLLDADDRAAYIVHRGEHCCICLNKYPYNGGHLLVLPFREVAELEKLTPEEYAELFELLRFGKRLLDETLKPEGLNVGLNLGAAAGAGVPTHLHLHIVPRWSGDTNFLPVLGGPRVLPIALDNLWERLSDRARALTATS